MLVCIGEKKLQACLVCKVVSTKGMSRECFRAYVSKLLQLVGSVNIEILGKNHPRIFFSNSKEESFV